MKKISPSKIKYRDPATGKFADFPYVAGANTEELELEIKSVKESIVDLSVYVTPQMFGAKGNGTTDDTDAFRQAIASGKLIFVPSGVYRITDTLNIDKQILIDGNGCESSIIEFTGSGYLFNISTNTKNRAVIKNMNFLGSSSNSLIYCGMGAWGSSFKMEDCLIRIFGGVIFDLVSSCSVSVLNTRIVASGVVKTRPFDSSMDVGYTLSNMNYFEGVYWTGYPRESTGNMFELNNAQYFAFRSCAFEAATNIFKLTNNSRDIVLNECNIEQINTVFDCDSSSEPPKFINIRPTYDFDKFNKNSGAIDYLISNVEPTAKLFVRSGTDTMGVLFGNTKVELENKMVVNNNASQPYASVYELSTHGLKTLLPINLKRSIYQNTKSITFDLASCTDNFNASAVYDIDAFIEYEDGSNRWITASVFGKSLNNMVISNTMIKKVSGTVTFSDNDRAVFTLSGTTLKYTGDYSFTQLTLLVRSNVTGQAY